MENYKGNVRVFTRRKRKLEWIVLLTVFTLSLNLSVEVESHPKCPVSDGYLYAYPGTDDYVFEYTYDPLFNFKTDIDLIDRFLTSDDEVECEWDIRAKEGHFTSIAFTDFNLKPQTDTELGDCLYIYDGQNEEGPLLAELCGGDKAEAEYISTDRHLHLVFTQGESTGQRSFHMTYKAVPYPKDFIIRIATIASGSVAAVAVVFLAFKFSRNCRPCRKRCCPDRSMEEVQTHRELRPLTPQTLVPPSVSNTRGNDLRNEELSLQQLSVMNSIENQNERNASARPEPLTLVEGEVSEEEQHSPPPDEPPPSYDSIFGDLDEHNKTDQ